MRASKVGHVLGTSRSEAASVGWDGSHRDSHRDQSAVGKQRQGKEKDQQGCER